MNIEINNEGNLLYFIFLMGCLNIQWFSTCPFWQLIVVLKDPFKFFNFICRGIQLHKIFIYRNSVRTEMFISVHAFGTSGFQPLHRLLNCFCVLCSILPPSASAMCTILQGYLAQILPPRWVTVSGCYFWYWFVSLLIILAVLSRIN